MAGPLAPTCHVDRWIWLNADNFGRKPMTESRPIISVVIPAYNRRDSLLQLLADLVPQEGVSFEVIVVDDCSPDDTVDAVKNRFPAVRLFRNPVNSGPAVSRNRGVKEALGQFVVGFDSDVTVPDRRLLRRVADTFDNHHEATGLAFRLMQPGGLQDDAPRWWHPVPISSFSTKSFRTNYFSGTGYAFRKDDMISAGLFPEILYMHYEEVQLAFRILDQGGAIVHCPNLQVIHHASPVASRGKIHIFYKPRNQILVALSCYSWHRAVIYLIPRLTYHFFSSLFNRHFREFMSALKSAYKLSDRVLMERRPLRAATWRKIAAMSKV